MIFVSDHSAKELFFIQKLIWFEELLTRSAKFGKTNLHGLGMYHVMFEYDEYSWDILYQNNIM